MKLAMRDYTDVSTGATDEIAVTFDANAVAFYAQMSGLAKDKISYPIREVCTNAWDAGRGDFEVYLPTQLNPMFRVRDYGPGMSPDLMRSIYARMYASTKRDSNTSVGGWGLGRFSPFAYLISDTGAGSYTIVSYQDGVARTYVMSINQSGAPVLRLLAEMPTELRDGMEVSFAVHRGDINRFTYAAKRVLWSFEPRPRVFPEIDFEEPTVIQAGDGWTLFKPTTVPFETPHVRMGCVMYPFDVSALNISSDLVSYDDTILFEAPIGSLRVTLSREAIAYDDLTTSTLKAAVKRFETELLSGIQAKVDVATNYFEARKVLEDETQSMKSGRKKWLRDNITWRGMQLKESISSARAKFMLLTNGWDSVERFSRELPATTHVVGAKIVVEHNPNRSVERLIKANLVGTAMLWIRTKKADLDAVMADLGNPDFVVLDTITTEPRVSPSKTTIRKRKVMNTGRYTEHAEVRDVDTAAGGLKMLRQGGRSKYDGFMPKVGCSWSKHEFSSFIVFCRQQGWITSDQPILVTTYDEKPLGENWKWFGDVMGERLKELAAITPPSNLRNMSSRDMPATLQKIRDLMADTQDGPEDLVALSQKIVSVTATLGGRHAESDSDKARSWLAKLHHQVETDSTASPFPPLEREWLSIAPKYPMLDFILDMPIYGESYRHKQREMAKHYFSLLRKPDAPIDPE